MSQRLSQLNKHLIMNDAKSIFDHVGEAPPDPIFNLSTQYKNDSNPDKIDLSVGAYRTDAESPWVLPVVYEAESKILQLQKSNTSTSRHVEENNKSLEDHEYLPIDGLKRFIELSAELLLGKESSAINEGRTCTVQTISGTGANSLFAYFMKEYYNSDKKITILLSDPTWGNHKNIFKNAGLEVVNYPYFDSKTNKLDFENMIKAFNEAPKHSIVLLHACAHNPTGVDPTREEWKIIAKTIENNKLFPFFDCAYQGFASGDTEKDAFAIRYFVERNMELFIAQSYSKNFGLYGQRCGTLTFIGKNKGAANTVKSQLKRLSRATISNPPKHGAQIVKIILEDEKLKHEWFENLKQMSSRIIEMRHKLYNCLQKLETPGNWQHIIDQIGMFTFTGLNKTQCKALKEKFHVYLTENGRISMAGLNNNNVEKFAKYVDYVVRNVEN